MLMMVIPLVCIPSLNNIKMWSDVVIVWTNKMTMQRALYSYLSYLAATEHDDWVPFVFVHVLSSV